MVFFGIRCNKAILSVALVPVQKGFCNIWGVDRPYAVVLMGADLVSKPFKIVYISAVIAYRMIGRNPVVHSAKIH